MIPGDARTRFMFRGSGNPFGQSLLPGRNLQSRLEKLATNLRQNIRQVNAILKPGYPVQPRTTVHSINYIEFSAGALEYCNGTLAIRRCIELEWWAYVSFVFSFFVLCLGLNYVVKKINEAKIEERFIRMLQKASTTQSTQVNGPLIAVETSKTPQLASPPGISLVFNREQNKRRTDPYNMILKPAKDWKFEISSYKSMETINVISIKSDERTLNNSVPIKKIASERVAAKATSSHTEKVPVKKNEFGRRAVKQNSSITTKSDSYVTELISVKNNEYGHVAGINTLPITRKDCNTSVLTSENETGRIISPKSSPSIHIDHVIQDVTAKESVVKKESGLIKADGAIANEPKDSVADVVPLRNMYAGRIVTTNARNIVEVTVTKPIGLTDKKSNEEIDSGCFIRKSIDNLLSKIVYLTNKNEDLRKEKSATDMYVAKQSVSESNRNINEISNVEKKDSGCTVAKETSSHTQSDRVRENFPIVKRELGPIIAKETSNHARFIKDFFSVNMSVTRYAKTTPSPTPSDITVSQYFPIKRSESASIVARRKDPLLQETSYTGSENNVAESSLVNISESSHISVKQENLRDMVSEKKYEDTQTDFLEIKLEDSTVMVDSSNTTNVDADIRIPLKDRIRALIEDENVKDIMLCKPSSSSKK